MRKLVVFAVAAFVGSVMAAWAQDTVKAAIAVIDVQRVRDESALGKEAVGRLQKLNEDKRVAFKKLADARDDLKSQLTTQRATLSDAKVADLQKQVEDKEVELQRFQDDARQQLSEAERAEMDALEKQIMPIINELGREKKFLLIFNKFQSGLVFADEEVDVTDEVLRRLNTKVTK